MKNASVNIAGVDISKHKFLPYGLIKIKGIGLTSALKICESLKLNKNDKFESLTDEQILDLRNYIESNYVIGNELIVMVNRNISKLIDCRCYRGIRHQLKLPVRGQRTYSNANTARRGRKK